MPNQTVEDLGKLVKQKFPGSYDSMPDVEVGRKVKEKYPEYSQFTDIEDKSQDKGFFATLGEYAKGAGKVANAALNPFASPQPLIDAAKGIAQSHVEAGKGTVADIKKGDYVEGLSHGAATLIPMVGPFAWNIYQNIKENKPGEAAAGITALGVPKAMEMLPSVKIPMGLKNRNNKVQEAALSSLESKVQMTPGQRAGNIGRQKAERDLVNKPQTAGQASDYFNTQEEQLAAEGNLRIEKTGVPKTDIVGAAETARVELGKLINAGRAEAKSLYDSVRSDVAANRRTVQTGTKQSGILDAQGRPISTPITEDFDTPVAIAPVRAQLKPIWDELQHTFPEGKRAYSPAYGALSQFMNSDVTHMGAMDFDKFVGALKSISRKGDSPYLSTPSQALASKMISASESEVAKALQGAGPDTIAKLQKAREAVKEYHDVADFLEPLDSKESGAMYSKLTAGGERSYETVEYLSRKAPQVNKVLGRTLLEQLMEKATKEGGFKKTASVAAEWDRMGTRTKELLLGKAVTEDMDKFFHGAKLLNPAEGSQTAGRISALEGYGDIGKAVVEVIMGAGGGAYSGHFGEGLAAGAALAGRRLYNSRIQPANLARISFKPAGAKLLRNAMDVPINSPKFNETMRALEVMGEQEQAAQESPGSRALKKP